MIILALEVAVSIALSAVATGLTFLYARRHLLDQITERSMHTASTPRGGGLGLVVGLAGGLVFSTVRYEETAWPAYAVGALIVAIAALGWWDDHTGLGAGVRLAVQLLLATLMLCALGVPSMLTIGDWPLPVPMILMATMLVLGIAWLINLTNFMDGIDGLAGSHGVVSGATLALLLQGDGFSPWSALGWSLAGGSLGFLVWNWPPARIFMGDVGSTALGMCTAVLIIAGMHQGLSVELLLLPLAPFVLDATCTLIRRAWRRERLSQAHRSHLYQRLALHWGAHRPVTLLYTGLSLLGALGAWSTAQGYLPPLAAAGGMVIIFGFFVVYGRLGIPDKS